MAFPAFLIPILSAVAQGAGGGKGSPSGGNGMLNQQLLMSQKNAIDEEFNRLRQSSGLPTPEDYVTRKMNERPKVSLVDLIALSQLYNSGIGGGYGRLW